MSDEGKERTFTVDLYRKHAIDETSRPRPAHGFPVGDPGTCVPM
jgi:hypothetical protein